jgi:hypothetical protein
MKYLYGFVLILSGVNMFLSMRECNLDATLGWACAFFLSLSVFIAILNKKDYETA